ncbi:MAG: IS30 family transposase [Clostridiales bacterium]|nr:IS30 family transposase [Clostridiales bacterium]
MRYYYETGQLNMSDRIAIETGICRGESFKRIAKRIYRHPTTVSHEVKTNRTLIKGQFFLGNDCKFVRTCAKKGLCDSACQYGCRACRNQDCRKICDRYVSTECGKYEKPPYVCNTCQNKKLCNKTKYIYSAKYADAAVTRRRSESRVGIRLTDEQFREMDELITQYVRKGQPLTHIYAEHENELPVCLRSIYNYIDAGEMTIKNIDLRRKTGYRRRRGKKEKKNPLQAYREGRTYEDFLKNAKTSFTYEHESVEMDTVKGVRESGKRLLTMIFRKNSVMLLFLLPDGTAESVKRVFNYLEFGLGLETFRRLFPVILTDNGSEFKRPIELEYNDDLVPRTSVYYCDPMASWQKPHIEKNHEFIRYVIPRGKSLNPYTDEDITLLMNHINSIKRPSLGNKSPYELVADDDEDMHELMCLLEMDPIPADEVHLDPNLFKSDR